MAPDVLADLELQLSSRLDVARYDDGDRHLLVEGLCLRVHRS